MSRPMFIFGTRPEAIKLAPVIQSAISDQRFLPIVCATGQHREMTAQVLYDFNITPDHDLDIMLSNQTLAGLSARLIERIDQVLEIEKPDIVIVQGDTASALCGALTAFYRHIPVAHIEAGLRTHDLDSPFPEELNRLLIARLAKWHFPPTQIAAQNLLDEGVSKDTIHIVGNTVIDAIRLIQDGWPAPSPDRNTVLVTMHRRESLGAGIRNICHAVADLASAWPDLKFVFPVHLNPKLRVDVFEILDGLRNVELIEPVGFPQLLRLQASARLIITDSGGIQEEAPSFGTPLVVTREHTERTEGIEAGFATLVGTKSDAILAVAHAYLQDQTIHAKLTAQQNPYGSGYTSEAILNILAV